MPAKSDSQHPKVRALLEEGTLNPVPEKVQRSEIPRQRVLRPPRHRAGQVRDAAPRFGRECVGRPRNGRIRRIEADVLSDQGQLRRSGDRWVRAEEAGATRPSQAPGRSTGVYPKTPRRWQAHSSARAGEVGSAGIRSERTPEDDRASGRRKKNSEMKSNAAHGRIPLAVSSPRKATRLRAAISTHSERNDQGFLS